MPCMGQAMQRSLERLGSEVRQVNKQAPLEIGQSAEAYMSMHQDIADRCH